MFDVYVKIGEYEAFLSVKITINKIVKGVQRIWRDGDHTLY